jgi:predicted  nucleic acid-binding Zn-ribbon protein
MVRAVEDAMAQTEELKQQIQKALQSARTAHDQIRVDLHLASMEARDRWARLQPKLADAERLAHELTDTSRRAIEEISRSFSEFAASVRRPARDEHP